MKPSRPLALLLLATLLCAISPSSAQNELSGYVFVEDDGTLRLHGQTIHLFGIHIPDTDESCFTFISPPLCGPRAVIALEFRIGSDWVYCDIKERGPEGLIGLCRVDDEDLSAWMLKQGWALALPGAPFEYQALEKIARSQGRGIWGIPVRIPR
jgi:endonuclease YncB( thermonuclease family)